MRVRFPELLIVRLSAGSGPVAGRGMERAKQDFAGLIRLGVRCDEGRDLGQSPHRCGCTPM